MTPSIFGGDHSKRVWIKILLRQFVGLTNLTSSGFVLSDIWQHMFTATSQAKLERKRDAQQVVKLLRSLLSFLHLSETFLSSNYISLSVANIFRESIWVTYHRPKVNLADDCERKKYCARLSHLSEQRCVQQQIKGSKYNDISYPFFRDLI